MRPRGRARRRRVVRPVRRPARPPAARGGRGRRAAAGPRGRGRAHGLGLRRARPGGRVHRPGELVGVVRLGLLEWLLPAAVAVVVWSCGARAAVGDRVRRRRGRRRRPRPVPGRDGLQPGDPAVAREQPATGAIRFLQSRRPERFVGLDAGDPARGPRPAQRRHPLRAARRPRLRLPGRAALRGALARGRRRAPACDYVFCVGSVGIRPAAFRALGLFGVTHLVQTPTDAPVPGLRVAYAGPRRPHLREPLRPAARVPRRPPDGRRGRRRGPRRRHRARLPGPDDRRDRAAAARPAQRVAAADRAGEAAITRYEPERVVVRARGERPSLLVLGDSFFPGWTARSTAATRRSTASTTTSAGCSSRPGRTPSSSATGPRPSRSGRW